MVKFSGKDENGRPLIGLGLSRANCERLLAGEPIQISLDELVQTLDAQILLFAGETEEAMKEEFTRQGLIRPETKIRTMHPDDPHAR